jgi:hypothetical protein
MLKALFFHDQSPVSPRRIEGFLCFFQRQPDKICPEAEFQNPMRPLKGRFGTKSKKAV